MTLPKGVDPEDLRKMHDQEVRAQPCVCEFFRQKAAAAADGWDGQDNADLLELLADQLGISLWELEMTARCRRRQREREAGRGQ